MVFPSCIANLIGYMNTLRMLKNRVWPEVEILGGDQSDRPFWGQECVFSSANMAVKLGRKKNTLNEF